MPDAHLIGFIALIVIAQAIVARYALTQKDD
jgi:hypothetical protein